MATNGILPGYQRPGEVHAMLVELAQRVDPSAIPTLRAYGGSGLLDDRDNDVLRSLFGSGWLSQPPPIHHALAQYAQTVDRVISMMDYMGRLIANRPDKSIVVDLKRWIMHPKFVPWAMYERARELNWSDDEIDHLSVLSKNTFLMQLDAANTDVETIAPAAAYAPGGGIANATKYRPKLQADWQAGDWAVNNAQNGLVDTAVWNNNDSLAGDEAIFLSYALQNYIVALSQGFYQVTTHKSAGTVPDWINGPQIGALGVNFTHPLTTAFITALENFKVGAVIDTDAALLALADEVSKPMPAVAPVVALLAALAVAYNPFLDNLINASWYNPMEGAATVQLAISTGLGADAAAVDPLIMGTVQPSPMESTTDPGQQIYNFGRQGGAWNSYRTWNDSGYTRSDADLAAALQSSNLPPALQCLQIMQEVRKLNLIDYLFSRYRDLQERYVVLLESGYERKWTPVDIGRSIPRVMSKCPPGSVPQYFDRLGTFISENRALVTGPNGIKMLSSAVDPMRTQCVNMASPFGAMTATRGRRRNGRGPVLMALPNHVAHNDDDDDDEDVEPQQQ